MTKIIKNSIYMLRYVFMYCPYIVTFSSLISLLNIANSFFNIYFMKIILDVASEILPLSYFIYFVLFQFCFSIVFSLLSLYHQLIFMPRQSQILEEKMQTELYNKLIEIELSKYDDTEFYNIYTLATGNANQRALSVLETIISFFSSIINLTALTTLLFTLDTLILLAAITVSFIVFIINTILSKLSYKSNKESIYPSRKLVIFEEYFIGKITQKS